MGTTDPAQSLVPCFIPPLALILAHAERAKDAPLAEDEVTQIRDDATCIMMEPADAAQMEQKRGFRDVNPRNCWSDWHRLRVEMTGRGYLPKVVLCLPGPADFRDRCATILKDAKVEYEFRPHDERMAGAFRATALRVDPSLSEEDLERIIRHATVLYVLSENFPSRGGTEACHKFLRLGRQLLEAGGLAVKCESSGIAHSRARWIELAEQAGSRRDDSHGAALWSALLRAYVQLPIRSRPDLYSCGMHLLGKPDLIVNEATVVGATGSQTGDGREAADLFGVFAMYLLSECPEGAFGSGHTFSIGPASPRYRVTWEPCIGYDEDDLFFNPFGRWRFSNT